MVRTRRTPLPTFFVTLSFVALCCLAPSAAAAQSRAARQSPSTQPSSSSPANDGEAESLRLIEKGEQEADELLRKGAELRRQGETAAALKAYEQAVKGYVKVYLRETAGSNMPLRPDATAEDRANFRRSLSAVLTKAAESVDGYLALGGTGIGFVPDEDARGGLKQLEALRAHARLLNETDASRAAYWPNEVERKARIISKREPMFTEEARQERVNGTVVLRMVLMPDGKVSHILILKGLPAGLSEEAIEAASQMRFEPAIKDGRPVAQFITISYGFRTY
ncbi:MAG TPA: energy transducer TonB [Pyrinomonadaceae bacterium]|nr:energy transducer TonB [Pyrinomonadaceae bacterium]